MKLKYEASKGRRFKSARRRKYLKDYHQSYVFVFYGMQAYSWDNNGEDWWFDKINKKWIHGDDLNGVKEYSSSETCRTVKEFRRRLKKASKYMPSGVKFTLWSKIKGCNVYGVTK